MCPGSLGLFLVALCDCGNFEYREDEYGCNVDSNDAGDDLADKARDKEGDDARHESSREDEGVAVVDGGCNEA
jgi:hypothetical protein